MAIRHFIFCDNCNPQGLRSIECRRAPRDDGRSGRRILDGRTWFEGNLNEAVSQAGWIVTTDGRHLCPNCQKN